MIAANDETICLDFDDLFLKDSYVAQLVKNVASQS